MQKKNHPAFFISLFIVNIFPFTFVHFSILLFGNHKYFVFFCVELCTSHNSKLCCVSVFVQLWRETPGGEGHYLSVCTLHSRLKHHFPFKKDTFLNFLGVLLEDAEALCCAMLEKFTTTVKNISVRFFIHQSNAHKHCIKAKFIFSIFSCDFPFSLF